MTETHVSCFSHLVEALALQREYVLLHGGHLCAHARQLGTLRPAFPACPARHDTDGTGSTCRAEEVPSRALFPPTRRIPRRHRSAGKRRDTTQEVYTPL
jgi:hypothetical protein